jgi:hypothetical protein
LPLSSRRKLGPEVMHDAARLEQGFAPWPDPLRAERPDDRGSMGTAGTATQLSDIPM